MSWTDRLVDRVVPDRVLMHSFPRMGLSAKLGELARDRPVPSDRVAEADAEVWRTREAS